MAASAADPAMDRFDGWSKGLFALIATVFGLAGAWALLGGSSGDPVPAGIVGLGALIAAAILGAMAVAIERRASWARPAALAMLWVLVVSGVIDTVVKLAAGTLNVPLGTIGAVMVLRTLPPGGIIITRSDQRVIATVLGIALIASVGAPLVVQSLLQSGSNLLSGDPERLQVTANITCPELSDPSSERLTIVADWRWGGDLAFAQGIDGLAIGWTGQDADGAPVEVAMIDADASPPAAGVTVGASGSPSSAPLHAAVAPAQAWTFMIDTSVQRFFAGTASIVLARPDGDHGSISAFAVYAHLDRWTKASDTVTCAW